MISVALFYLVAVTCSGRGTLALPLYPDTSLEPQADFIQKLVSEVQGGPNTAAAEQREVNHLYPLLMKHNRGVESWNRGAKDSEQQDKFANMVENLGEAVLKMEAAERLRSQGFLRSEQTLPKANKRACFWKYCVTN